MNKRGLINDILAKLDKIEDISWEDIVDKYELEYSPDHIRKLGYGMRMYRDIIGEETKDENEKLLEIKLEKTRLSDMRTECNRRIRSLARLENIVDLIKENIVELANEKPMIGELNIKKESSGNDGLLCLSDLHIGMEVNNTINKYNIDIAKERLKTTIEKAIINGKRHDIDKLHIILNGDLISAELHSSIKLSNAESLTKQIVLASEIISECIFELSKHFYCTVSQNIGNHEAVEFLKDDRSNKNNYSMIINEMIKLRLKDVPNVMFIEGVNHCEMTVSRIKNLNVISTHGDQVSLNRCSEQLEMATGVKPDLIILGHYHRQQMMSQYDTEIYINGSLVSTDEYAYKKKLYNPPSQLMLIIDDEGVECSYIIKS